MEHGGIEETFACLIKREGMGAAAEIAAKEGIGFAGAFEKNEFPGHGHPTGDGEDDKEGANNETCGGGVGDSKVKTGSQGE
jgi:hypothetical protein